MREEKSGLSKGRFFAVARVSSAALLVGGNVLLGVFLGEALVKRGFPDIVLPLVTLLLTALGFCEAWRVVRDVIRQ